MTNETAARKGPLKLKYSERGGQVLVEPEDEDRFMMSIGEAIRACRIYEKEDYFRHQFESLKNYLGLWISKHQHKIFKAFLTLKNDRLLLLLVTRGAIYDNDLEEALTDLDIKIARNEHFSQICLSVQSLPFCSEEAYGSFFNPELVLEYVRTNA